MKMETTINMNRFLLAFYIICLVHAQVPQNCVESMVVNDIDTGGSHLAKIFEHQHQLQQQHHLRHGHIQNHHHRHHQHHHNSNYQQAEAHHYVDAGNHNDVEIGHTQPNMVNFVINKTISPKTF